MTWCNMLRFIYKFIYLFYFPFYPICINWLFKHTHPYLLYCIWLGCIRSCTKDTSHGSLINRYVVHSQLIDLGNSIEIIVHYLLIGGMTCLSHRDKFPMVNELVCMITHWIGPKVNHDLSLSTIMIHQATSLHGLSILKGY